MFEVPSKAENPSSSFGSRPVTPQGSSDLAVALGERLEIGPLLYSVGERFRTSTFDLVPRQIKRSDTSVAAAGTIMIAFPPSGEATT